jgi:hypothetical protein
MAKLSYRGTGRPCLAVFQTAGGPKACTNQASRGADYCLRCKHRRQLANLPVARTR